MSKENNFIDLCLRGEALPEEIDDWIDEWHDHPQQQELHEFLGMDWAEYTLWISAPEMLAVIITDRRENKRYSKH